MAQPGSAEWLDLVREEPVDPKRRIVDPHHHMWPKGEGLTWGQPYLLEDLRQDIGSGHNVTETVFIECAVAYRKNGPAALRPVGETEFAAGEAARSTATPSRIAGIIGHADLSLGDGVVEVLQAHEAAAPGLFKGIRQVVAADPSMNMGAHASRQGLLGEPKFRQGLTRLGAEGYSFEAMIFHPQLPQLIEVVRAVPGTTIVLNHLGVPLNFGSYQNRSDVKDDWRRGLRQLAECPNMVVKLGGIGMDFLFGLGWSKRELPPTSDEVVAHWADDIRWCIDTFGPNRCMFESNFPVDKGAIGYTVLWNGFQKIAARYSEAEQEALFSGNALRTYRIASRA
jgi:predicted TIM-barrel fold metal-dependent hydrolase